VNKIETHYIIDYENVGAKGLKGCNNLGERDHIDIVFTSNASNLDMRAIADHGKAKLNFMEVPPGKQSADAHINTYIGYYVCRKCNVVVVSKDHGYDKVIEFWKKKTGLIIKRKEQIKGGIKENLKPDKKATATEEQQMTEKKPNNVACTETNNTIIKTLAKSDIQIKGDSIGQIASIAIKNLKKGDGKKDTKETVVNMFGKEKGCAIFKKIEQYI
jgi:hypothetical protein